MYFGVIIERGCFVGVEDALEVVHLMLEDVRQKARRAARHFRTLFIVRTYHRLLRARHDAPFAAHRKAPFVFLFFRTRHLEDDGIDVDLVGGRWCAVLLRRGFGGLVGSIPTPPRKRAAGDDKKPQRHSELGGGERPTVLFFGKERFHFRDKFFYSDAAYVRNRDFTRNLPQRGILVFGQNTTHTRNYNVSSAPLKADKQKGWEGSIRPPTLAPVQQSVQDNCQDGCSPQLSKDRASTSATLALVAKDPLARLYSKNCPM